MKERVAALIKGFPSGTTVVAVDHDLQFVADIADAVVCMDQGTIALNIGAPTSTPTDRAPGGRPEAVVAAPRDVRGWQRQSILRSRAVLDANVREAQSDD